MSVLVATCAGIVADRAWGLSAGVWSAAAGLAWAAWLPLWRCRCDPAAAIVLLVSVAACGGLWHHLQWNRFAPDDLGCFAQRLEQPVCVEAIAVAGPRALPAPEFNPMRMIPEVDRTSIELRVLGIRDGAHWRPASGRSRLTVDGHLLGIHAGDRLRVFGQLSALGRPENPGEFDQAAYRRADRQLSRLRTGFPECVSVVQPGSSLSPRRWLDRVRTAGLGLLHEHLDERQAELAATVLLGAREEIGTRRMQAFVETGTVHLLAISGLHVGIAAGAFGLGLRLLLVPARRAAIAVAAAAVVYTLLADAQPPAVRATILVLALCASTCMGRPQSAFNSLAAAGLVVLGMNPADLFNTGVHLSFLAAAGLMWFAPHWFGSTSEPDPLARLVWESRRLPARILRVTGSYVRHLTLVSGMIWLLTLPLVIARFHVLAPVSILLNTVLWLPTALALVCGFAVLVFGWLVPPLAAVAGWCCNGSLWLLEGCVHVGRSVASALFLQWWVPGPPEWWLVGFYAGLGVLAAFPRLRPPRRWCVAALAGWIAVGFTPWALRSHAGRLNCTFFSVGHGCSVLLELPSGQAMLYDAGCFGAPEFAAWSVARGLWSRGITHLDAVILSHADADHYNLLPDLLERFSVGVIYVSPVMFERENLAMLALRQAIDQAGVPVREIYAGDRLQGGEGCRIEVLHPPKRGVIGEDNANSIVLAIEYLGRRLLIPGDLESPGLNALLAEEPWDCDVLLAPHHGSRASNPPGLAGWCRPDWVVISGSLERYQPETADTYRHSGAQVFHTGEIGAIRCIIDADGLRVGGTLQRAGR